MAASSDERTAAPERSITLIHVLAVAMGLGGNGAVKPDARLSPNAGSRA